MKKVLKLSILVFCAALITFKSYTQCPANKPAIYQPPGLFDFKSAFGVGKSETFNCYNGQWAKGVYPRNATSSLQVNWQCEFSVNSNKSKLRYKIKIYRILSSKDVTKFILYDKVFESNLAEKTNHYSSKLYTEFYNMSVAPGYTYRAEVHYQTKNSGAWPPIWSQTESNTWNVYAACIPISTFKINGNTSINITFPLAGQINMDFPDAVNCTEKQFIAVQPCSSSGNVFGFEKTLWQPANNTSLNLKTFYNFQKNNYYRIKLAVGDPWTERTVILYIN